MRAFGRAVLIVIVLILLFVACHKSSPRPSSQGLPHGSASLAASAGEYLVGLERRERFALLQDGADAVSNYASRFIVLVRPDAVDSIEGRPIATVRPLRVWKIGADGRATVVEDIPRCEGHCPGTWAAIDGRKLKILFGAIDRGLVKIDTRGWVGFTISGNAVVFEKCCRDLVTID